MNLSFVGYINIDSDWHCHSATGWNHLFELCAQKYLPITADTIKEEQQKNPHSTTTINKVMLWKNAIVKCSECFCRHFLGTFHDQFERFDFEIKFLLFLPFDEIHLNLHILLHIFFRLSKPLIVA